MKNIFLLLSLGLSLVSVRCSNVETNEIEKGNEQASQNTKHINKDVNVTEFAELINTGEGQILDVRTPEEWAEGSIAGAKKMNFFDDTFNDQLSKLDKTKPVYVYCKSGGRSGKAAKKMDKMGFTKIYNLTGGITAWNDAGKPTIKQFPLNC